jgi:hypothetical protein
MSYQHFLLGALATSSSAKIEDRIIVEDKKTTKTTTSTATVVSFHQT